MRKLITPFIIAVLGFLAFSHMYMLYVCDISLAPVQPECQEEVHLVSYTDGPDVFKQNQNFQAFTAINKGISHIHMYRRKDLDAEFVEKNKAILDQSRGAGWWLWKPYVILKTLKSLPENAVAIYMDSGFSLIGHVQKLVECIKEHDIGVVVHDDLGTTLQSITQPETLSGMGCFDEACLSAPHAWAGIMVIKNTPSSRLFIKKWMEACENGSWLTQASQVQHNADEAILSVLCYQDPENKRLVPTSELQKMRVVKWHHRHPQNSSKSLFPYASNRIKLWFKSLYWLWTKPLEQLQ